MKESKIIEMYLSGLSMREVANTIGTNHKLISRVLKRNGIETRKPLNNRGDRKFNCKNELRYNNMATHLRFNIDLNWIMSFSDFDKLKLLNDVITNRGGRFDESTDWYIEYINRFYSDDKFNEIYSKWVLSGFDPYKKPSIDHILPRSLGGGNDISNLQFMTWFENRCKNNMTQQQWDVVKLNVKDYFI